MRFCDGFMSFFEALLGLARLYEVPPWFCAGSVRFFEALECFHPTCPTELC